jgi:anaphase-promoting complex subunit 5
MYQSSHLNIKENISNCGSQMLLQSTLYSRLGMPHMANVHCELLLDCYSHSCPIDERIRAIGRRAFIMSQNGRYDDAIVALDSIDFAIHRSLKYHQYLLLCTGVIKFKQAIRRYIFEPSSMYVIQY